MNKNELTLKRYKVPSKRGEGWGLFVIGSDGYFSAVSDYGNYAFMWTATGCDDFRDFLIDMVDDPWYLISKLDSTQEYDREATIKTIKRRIIEMRRAGDLTKEEAREEYYLIDDHNELFDQYDYNAWGNETRLDASEFYCTKSPSDVEHFAKVLFPRFVEMLKEEKAAEAKTEKKETENVTQI